jgi:uncharacterized membrane protein HdeD (DUF308 family)
MEQREGNDPAEMLQTLGRSWGWVLLFGIVTLILGILVVIDPQSSVTFVAVVIGIEIVISGIFRLVASFTAEGEGHRIWWILLRALSIVVGVFLIRHLDVTLSILPVVVGIFWIIQGVMEFFAAVANRDMPSRGWTMFMGVVGLVAGIVVVSWPIQSIVTLAWVLGIWLVLYGLMTIFAALQVKKFAGEVRIPAA